MTSERSRGTEDGYEATGGGQKRMESDGSNRGRRRSG